MPLRPRRSPCYCSSLSPRSLSLLIVEAGARLPPSFAPDPGGFLVLFQQSDESPHAFSQRVLAQHRELCQSGVRLERVLVAVGHGSSEETLSARYRLARHLIVRSESVGGETAATRELVFLVPTHHADRHELRALASTLEESLFGSAFRVNVELPASLLASGVTNPNPIPNPSSAEEGRSIQVSRGERAARATRTLRSARNDREAA
jgi:hypothetical protein